MNDSAAAKVADGQAGPAVQVPLAGVMGWPVAHSRSPALHGHWLKRYGVAGHYVPLAVRPEHLGQVLHALPRAGFVGVNVTIPHKEAVLALADVVTDRAALIGAADVNEPEPSVTAALSALALIFIVGNTAALGAAFSSVHEPLGFNTARRPVPRNNCAKPSCTVKLPLMPCTCRAASQLRRIRLRACPPAPRSSTSGLPG